MRQTIKARYHDGVLQPLEPLALTDDAEVQVTVDTELALGAVDESGHIHVNAVARELGIDRDDLAETAGDELARIRERRARYGQGRPALDPNGRVVIVVDDGLATGATMHAALAALRACKPARLICALPVAAADSLRREVSGMADEVVCLSTPDDFQAVGQYYRYFPQVGDDEVVALLRQKARSLRASPPDRR